jgi:hypothetical protein
LKVSNRNILATQSEKPFLQKKFVFDDCGSSEGVFYPKNNGFFDQTDYADEGWRATFFEWHRDCLPNND